MAEAEDKKQTESNEKEAKKKSVFGKLLPWIIMFVVAGMCAGAGLGLGKILAGTGDETSSPDSSTTGQGAAENELDLSSESDKYWYYDLEPPVTAYLNNPGITRYVSASLTLQMVSAKEKEVREYLDEKKPILRNWLYVYLLSLKLENVQGDKNMKSIQTHICDSFNEELFPNQKPQIKQILIREFAIQ